MITRASCFWEIQMSHVVGITPSLCLLAQDIRFSIPNMQGVVIIYYCDIVSKFPCSLVSVSCFGKLIGSYPFLYVSQMGFKMHQIPWKLFNRVGSGVSKS